MIVFLIKIPNNKSVSKLKVENLLTVTTQELFFWPQLNHHLIMSQSEDYRVEDGLEDDEGVADCVEEKPLDRADLAVAELTPLQITMVNIDTILKDVTFWQMRRCAMETGIQQRRQETKIRTVTLAALLS